MKKEYRRAVCYTLGVAWLIFTSPLTILGYIGEFAVTIGGCVVVRPLEWLKSKLRIYDHDPD